jgi:hypothetical protein
MTEDQLLTLAVQLFGPKVLSHISNCFKHSFLGCKAKLCLVMTNTQHLVLRFLAAKPSRKCGILCSKICETALQ